MAIQSELLLAVRQLASEREIDIEDVLNSLESAMIAAYKKDYNLTDEEKEQIEVHIDRETGEINMKRNGEEIPKAEFGRVATQSARQVLLQKMKEAERNTIMKSIQDKIGTIQTGTIQRMSGSNVLIDVNKAIAIMPPQEQIKGEFYKSAERIKVFLLEVQSTPMGDTLIVSRSTPQMLEELFKNEVPEIASGSIEIMAIAREAGSRSKVAVRSLGEGIDPIGSCVGQKGVRINAIIDEINEKVDIILWDKDIKTFIKNSLSPAKVTSIEIDEEKKEAYVRTPNDQTSLAIGKEGQNARLAAKLTGWKIDITPDTPEEQEENAPSESSGSSAAHTEESEQIPAKIRGLLEENNMTSNEDIQKIVNGEIKVKGIGAKAIESLQNYLTNHQQ